MENGENTTYRMSGDEIPKQDEFASSTDTSYTQTNSTETSRSEASYTDNRAEADTTQSQNNGFYNNYDNFNNQSFNNQSFNNQFGQAQTGFNTYQTANTTAPKKNKKGKKTLKRIVSFCLAAVLFGVIAGSVMCGVNYLGNKYVTKTAATQTPTIATVSAISAIQGDSDSSTTTSSQTSIDAQSIATSLLPAMVELNGTTIVSQTQTYGFGASNYQANTSGTGIIIGQNDTEILIVTNAHVIEDVNNLTAVFVDGTSAAASVKGSKTDKDIAVVAVDVSSLSSDTASKIAIAELDYTSEVAVGQPVVAIGNALGEGQSVTNGIISALNRTITVDNTEFSGLIMTNATINSGNSGGALINADGKVIAINFAKTSSDGVEGMAYAIPISNVVDLINTLMNKQTRTKVSESEAAFLGVSGVDMTEYYASVYGYPTGVLIRTVQSGSAAEKAGLESYDIITGFDDTTISSMSGLTSLLQYYKAGETVTIEYYHLEGSSYVLKTAEVTLGARS